MKEVYGELVSANEYDQISELLTNTDLKLCYWGTLKSNHANLYQSDKRKINEDMYELEKQLRERFINDC